MYRPYLSKPGAVVLERVWVRMGCVGLHSVAMHEGMGCEVL